MNSDYAFQMGVTAWGQRSTIRVCYNHVPGCGGTYHSPPEDPESSIVRVMLGDRDIYKDLDEHEIDEIYEAMGRDVTDRRELERERGAEERGRRHG